MQRILFDLNVPMDLTQFKNTNLFVAVSAIKFSSGRIGAEFIDLDTNLVCKVTDWMQLRNYAQECAEKQWQARDNAIPVTEEFIALPINN